MRVDVSPRRLSAPAGKAVPVTVTVTNTGSIISGHRVRILGIDPQWATLDQDSLLLFPETTGVAVLTVALPKGLPAGVRRVGIEVTELTDPNDVKVVELEVTVPALPSLKVALDPVSTTGGSRTEVAVVVDNAGNSLLDVDLHGADEEGAIAFGFAPPVAALGPGEQAITTARLKARRPWFGTPKVRPFTVEAGVAAAPVIAHGAWVQKPRLSRGALALLGLLIAATVFAAVIVATLSRVVDQSNANRDLALQVAEAANRPGPGGRGSVAGTVSLLTSGAPVGGVTVELFQADSPAEPIVSTATGATGGYTFADLVAGSYKVRFRGAGFTELWYPQSLTADNATPVTLSDGQHTTGIDIRLGGLPATVTGRVQGDTNGANLTLELPAPGGTPGAVTQPTAATPAADVPTVVSTQTLDASGNFSLVQIPSPALYQLVVTKPGFAPAVQAIDLGGGQVRNNLSIMLEKGDGSISGTVTTAKGPLGGAAITASDSTTSISTVSVTTPGQVGSFLLSDLPTPDTLTLVVSAPGYATQTLSISLTAGERATGVTVSMVTGIGDVSGTVTAGGHPTGGVTVTATDGQVTASTVTLSVGKVGTYQLTGLPVPGTYTITFSRPDLSSETQAISLSATTPNLTNINASMISDTASVRGTITETGGQPVGEVTISLTSGATSYQVISATLGTPGAYEIDGITPGTYSVDFSRPGGLPTSSVLVLTAGQTLTFSPVLAPAASITGHVVSQADPTQPVAGVQVLLYLATQYPTVVTETTTTDGQGNFTFANVDAPQSYIVAFAFPPGSANQETVLVRTDQGAVAPVCGSNSTGLTTTTTSTSTTSTTTPTTGATGSCDPQTDPIVVSTG